MKGKRKSKVPPINKDFINCFGGLNLLKLFKFRTPPSRIVLGLNTGDTDQVSHGVLMDDDELSCSDHQLHVRIIELR